MKTEVFDQPGKLMAATLAEIKDRDLFEVHRVTKLPYYWLKKFANGEFKNPSVNRIEALYNHLTGTILLP